MGIVLKSNAAFSGALADLPYVPVLDLQAGAAQAFSVARKLSSSYAGKAIRVRRSSDNTEADIGFNGFALDEVALAAHVGAGDGFVTTVYAQDGSGANLIQVATGAQAKIVSAGAILKQNGIPSMWFDGVDDRYTFANTAILQNKSHAYALAVFSALASGKTLLNVTGGTGLARFVISTGAGANLSAAAARRLDADASTSASVANANNTLSLFTAKALYAAGSVAAQRNLETAVAAALPSGAGATSNTASSTTPCVGSTQTPDAFFSGYLSELVLFNTDISATLAELQDEIIGYYGLA